MVILCYDVNLEKTAVNVEDTPAHQALQCHIDDGDNDNRFQNLHSTVRS